MKITKVVNNTTFIYYSETLDAMRSLAQSTVDALACIHKTKETVEQARIAWFIATSENMRKPMSEDATLAMLATKQKDRTKAQAAHYSALSKAWLRFRDQHGLEKAQPRGKTKDAKADAHGKTKDAKPDARGKTKDVTPKASNAKQADAYLRQQAATMSAYAEKNRAVLSTAMLHAIAEFAEAMAAIPNQD